MAHDLTTSKRLKSIRNQKSHIAKRKELSAEAQNQQLGVEGHAGRKYETHDNRGGATSPQDLKEYNARGSRGRQVWIRAVPNTTSLAPDELKLCHRAFHQTAACPFVCKAPTRRFTQKGTSSVVLPSQPAVNIALQRLGVFLQQDELKAMLQRYVKASDSSVSLNNFIEVVQEAKQRTQHRLPRDADVMEAYTGLGGPSDSLSEGGIPASNLHAFMKQIGIHFDEHARIDDQGDLVEFDYDATECSESDDGMKDADDVTRLPEKQGGSKPNFFSITTEGDYLKRFRIGVWVVVAANRLCRALVPWFLDSAALAALPPTRARFKSDTLRRVEFRAASQWQGRLHGYYFTRGPLGLGYYTLKMGKCLPSFHIEAFAMQNYKRPYEPENPAESVLTSDEVPEEVLPEPANDEEASLPLPIRQLRYRMQRGKELLQKAITEKPPPKRVEQQAPEPLVPVPQTEIVVEDMRKFQSIDSPLQRMWVGPQRDGFLPVVDDMEYTLRSSGMEHRAGSEGDDAPRTRSKHGLKLSHASDTPAMTMNKHGSEPRLPAAATVSAGHYVFKPTAASLSGVFSASSRNKAGSPIPKTFADTVMTAFRKSEVVNGLTAKDELPQGDDDLPEVANIAGFAPSANDDVFRQFENGRKDRRGPTCVERLWQGAQIVRVGAQHTKARFKREALLQEERALRADKCASQVLQEVIISVMARRRAAHITRLWRRHVKEAAQFSDTVANNLLEHSWLAWREAMEVLDNCGSDQLSRTYTERLGELDDQYNPEWESEYEATNDPEMGVKLARLAQELGLRTGNEDEEDNERDDEYERLSQLSDIATAQRLIPFEDFAAFFDRFRLYKGHHHVCVFKLPARPRRAEKTVGEMLREKLPAFVCDPTTTNRAETTTPQPEDRVEGPSTVGEDVLITSGGGLIQPVAGLSYHNTPRRLRVGLLKGSARFVPFDWASACCDLKQFDEGERCFDTVETMVLRNALRQFNLRQQFKRDHLEADASSSEGSSAIESDEAEPVPTPVPSPAPPAAPPSSPELIIDPIVEQFLAQVKRTTKWQHSTEVQQMGRTILMLCAESTSKGRPFTVPDAVLERLKALNLDLSCPSQAVGSPALERVPSQGTFSPVYDEFAHPEVLHVAPPSIPSILNTKDRPPPQARGGCLVPAKRPVVLLPADRLRKLEADLGTKSGTTASRKKRRPLVRRAHTQAKAERIRLLSELQARQEKERHHRKEKCIKHTQPRKEKEKGEAVTRKLLGCPEGIRIVLEEVPQKKASLSGTDMSCLSPQSYVMPEEMFEEVDAPLVESDLRRDGHTGGTPPPVMTPVPPQTAPLFTRGGTPARVVSPEQLNYRIASPNDPRSMRRVRGEAFDSHIKGTYLQQARRLAPRTSARPLTPFW